MGCDICYTNHAEADQDDMDVAADAARRGRLHLHHGHPRLRRRDAQLPDHLVPRRAVRPAGARTRPAPEFDAWLQPMGIVDEQSSSATGDTLPEPFARALARTQPEGSRMDEPDALTARPGTR